MRNDVCGEVIRQRGKQYARDHVRTKEPPERHSCSHHGYDFRIARQLGGKEYNPVLTIETMANHILMTMPIVMTRQKDLGNGVPTTRTLADNKNAQETIPPQDHL